ncbi:MAG: hypothetical protein EOP06_11695 [Proteobacteria bacterium]|nr:MAG: hypothetical protein EOP06_11695 [Pseudomonadota bacterium]
MQESEHVVFATPVYWYSMSAPLKNFFEVQDRGLKYKSVR